MALQRGPGLILFAVGCLLLAGALAAARLGLLQRIGTIPHDRLSAGDFPAGVSAPVGDVRSVPLRPTRIGFVPRGSSASLLLAAGKAVAPEEQARRLAGGGEGLFKTAYSLDAVAVAYPREEDLRKDLQAGGDANGVDMAVLPVDGLAQW